MSDTAAALKDVFDKMPGRLNADAASGLDCVIQHDITGDGGGNYYVTIKDGTATVSEGSHESPSMTLTMEVSDFVALSHGELDGMAACMGGRLKIAGDMGLALKVTSLFTG